MTQRSKEDDICFDVLMASADAHKRGALAIWTIYDRPLDYPDGFIARLHEVPGGPTDMTLAGELEEIRKMLWRAGMMKLTRDDKDEPPIVESWV